MPVQKKAVCKRTKEARLDNKDVRNERVQGAMEPRDPSPPPSPTGYRCAVPAFHLQVAALPLQTGAKSHLSHLSDWRPRLLFIRLVYVLYDPRRHMGCIEVMHNQCAVTIKVLLKHVEKVRMTNKNTITGYLNVS